MLRKLFTIIILYALQLMLKSSEAFTSPTSHAFLSSSSQDRFMTMTTTQQSMATSDKNADHSVFLTPETAIRCIQVANGTPLYAYSLQKLKENADACLTFPNAYGLTVRYAMKACPNGTILKYFNKRGIHIDASSGYEVRRAIANGIPPENISLSSQELPQDFNELVDMGVKINAW